MSEVSEYQKVAALVCGDIDTLLMAAESNPENALEFFRKLKSMKDDMTTNEYMRDTRYAASLNIQLAMMSGNVRCDKV